MRGRLWLKYFTEMSVAKRKGYSEQVQVFKDAEWTEFMRGVMDGVGEQMNCRVTRIRPENREMSGEYLNIDVVFIDNAEYALTKESKWDPFALPRAVVELENSYETMKISYCLWKILCVRSPIRVLICYQRNTKRVKGLKERLENVIWQGSLMKGTDGDLFVIVGDESARSETSWGKYFSVFEWRNDRLEKVEGLEW